MKKSQSRNRTQLVPSKVDSIDVRYARLSENGRVAVDSIMRLDEKGADAYVKAAQREAAILGRGARGALIEGGSFDSMYHTMGMINGVLSLLTGVVTGGLTNRGDLFLRLDWASILDSLDECQRQGQTIYAALSHLVEAERDAREAANV